VALAEDGERGIALATTWRPHIVLLDLGLPGIQGEEVAMIMKASEAPPIIVAYSGYERLEAKALAAGCDAFVLKPGLDALAEIVVSPSTAARRGNANDAAPPRSPRSRHAPVAEPGAAPRCFVGAAGAGRTHDGRALPDARGAVDRRSTLAERTVRTGVSLDPLEGPLRLGEGLRPSDLTAPRVHPRRGADLPRLPPPFDEVERNLRHRPCSIGLPVRGEHAGAHLIGATDGERIGGGRQVVRFLLHQTDPVWCAPARASRRPVAATLHGLRPRVLGRSVPARLMDAAAMSRVIARLQRAAPRWNTTALTAISHSTGRDPFRILIGCLLSLRTKDETTGPASARLFELAHTPTAILALPTSEIERAIYPVGFYRTKARVLHRVCRDLHRPLRRTSAVRPGRPPHAARRRPQDREPGRDVRDSRSPASVWTRTCIASRTDWDSFGRRRPSTRRWRFAAALRRGTGSG
jgi:CheY-like chemotaxis protein